MIIVRIPDEYSARIVIDGSVLICGNEEKDKRQSKEEGDERMWERMGAKDRSR